MHRDIKPDNIVLGRAHHRDRLFVVDLGLAKRASLDLPSSGAARKKLAGSARYCSIFTHDGLPQTYRDDLEGLAIVQRKVQTGGADAGVVRGS